MLIIYGSDLSSPANKVRFVANHLELSYEYRRVNLATGEHRNPEFLKMNPVGKVPFIDDDGFVLFESGAIIKYFANKTGSSIYPHVLRERAIVDQWFDFVTLHVGGAMQKIVYNRIFAPRRKISVDERALAEGEEFLKRFMPIVDVQLSGYPYLCGNNLTLADFTLLAVLDPAELANIDLGLYPKTMQWRMGLRQKSFYTKCYKEYGEFLKPGAKVT